MSITSRIPFDRSYSTGAGSLGTRKFSEYSVRSPVRRRLFFIFRGGESIAMMG